MTDSKPVFSVIIPSYNRRIWLEEAIRSVLLQTLQSFELIIVDDGSTDDTKEMLSTYCNYTFIHIINSSHKGAENARNLGVDKATGKYIVFLDSDDLLIPDALSYYNTILSKTDISLLIAHGTFFTQDAAAFHVPPIKPIARYSLFKNYITKKCTVWLSTSFIVIKKSAIVQNNIRFTPGTFPVDDLDYLLRAGTVSTCGIIHEPSTVYYRKHASNSMKDILANISRLHNILSLEKQSCYPGGTGNKIERLSLIGGHVQSWGRIAVKNGFCKEALLLFFHGTCSLTALLFRKTIALFSKRKIHVVDL